MKVARNVRGISRWALRILDRSYPPDVKIATVRLNGSTLEVALFAGSVDQEWVEMVQGHGSLDVNVILPDEKLSPLRPGMLGSSSAPPERRSGLPGRDVP